MSHRLLSGNWLDEKAFSMTLDLTQLESSFVSTDRKTVWTVRAHAYSAPHTYICKNIYTDIDPANTVLGTKPSRFLVFSFNPLQLHAAHKYAAFNTTNEMNDKILMDFPSG
jgi:hypothetical protein